jgi:hypothetical protein
MIGLRIHEGFNESPSGGGQDRADHYGHRSRTDKARAYSEGFSPSRRRNASRERPSSHGDVSHKEANEHHKGSEELTHNSSSVREVHGISIAPDESGDNVPPPAPESTGLAVPGTGEIV